MLQLLMCMAESFLFVSVCMCASMHVDNSVRVPPGIKFMKAYAWITSERWPQVANLMSPLYLLLCQPPSLPSLQKKPQSSACSFPPLLKNHDGQEWAICALLRGRGVDKTGQVRIKKEEMIL